MRYIHWTHVLTQVWIGLLDCDRDVACVLVLGIHCNVFEDIVMATEHMAIAAGGAPHVFV